MKAPLTFILKLPILEALLAISIINEIGVVECAFGKRI